LKRRRSVLTKLRNAILKAQTEKYNEYLTIDENPSCKAYFQIFAHHRIYSLIKDNRPALQLWMYGNRAKDLLEMSSSQFDELIDYLYEALMHFVGAEPFTYEEMSKTIDDYHVSYMDIVNGRTS
jgi:hypothetical protein